MSFRLIISEEATVNDSYFKALAIDEDLGRARGVDGALKKFNLDALLLPTDGLSCFTLDNIFKSLIRQF